MIQCRPQTVGRIGRPLKLHKTLAELAGAKGEQGGVVVVVVVVIVVVVTNQAKGIPVLLRTLLLLPALPVLVVRHPQNDDHRRQ